MTYFVMVYSRIRGQLLLGPEAFEEGQRADALQRRFALESQYGSTPDDIEVVVVSAESEAHLRTTHGRYFKTLTELAS